MTSGGFVSFMIAYFIIGLGFGNFLELMAEGRLGGKESHRLLLCTFFWPLVFLFSSAAGLLLFFMNSTEDV